MKRLLEAIAALMVLAIVGLALGAGLFYVLVLRDLPDIRSLADYSPNLITRVYAADGSVIASFFKEQREIVEIERIPTFVVQAFIAVEDDNFYEHEGLDYPGIVRAAWANLQAGGIKQGGSTITQQVAKTFLLSSERTYVRKIRDMVLARRIEEYLNKNEILYLYLNQIYLGSGAYGVQAAAKTYFDKSVDELTLAEAALIAGVVPAPSKYTPFNSREKARQRQLVVLRRMLEEGYISAEQLRQARDEEWQLSERAPAQAVLASAYFAEEVRRYLVDRYGSDEVLTGGLSVRTTLDLGLQQAAYRFVRKGLRDHDRRSGYRGPLRTVPEEEREAVLAELTLQNGEPPWEDGDVLQALVIATDDEHFARLSLGSDHETALELAGTPTGTPTQIDEWRRLAWARPPDKTVDGNAHTLKRVSKALRPGYLVELELVGWREPEALEVLAVDPDAKPPPPEPVFALYQRPLAQGALLSIDLEDERVLAMIGGYDFRESQFNRALQSKRQPGSAFKPIVYAAALREGYTPATTVYDTPIVYEDPTTGFTWKPENYSEKFYGQITLREALARSRNLATIKVLQKIKLPPVLRLAERLGIRGSLEPNLSLALGASEVTLAELLRAYSAFPSGGRWIEPMFIEEVRDRHGVLLEAGVPLVWKGADVDVDDGEPDPEAAQRELLDDVFERLRATLEDAAPAVPPGHVLDPITAYLMTDMLKAVVQEGTGWRAKRLGRPVAGKTGTTDNMFDAWFLGFSPELATGVWVGYDDRADLGKNESGSRAALPIWVDFMAAALDGRPARDFGSPTGIVYARVDRRSGLLAPAGADDFVFQPFRDGTAPTEFARLRNGDGRPRRPRLD